MESPRERVCQSCSAPAEHDQRWCLECGAELPQPEKRSGLKTGVGIATALTVLVGAASAGGYTLLQDGKKPPPPAATIAQTPPVAPPVDTAPPIDSTLPTDDDLTLPRDRGGGGTGGGTGGSTSDDFTDDFSDTGSDTGSTGGSTGGGTWDTTDDTTDSGTDDTTEDETDDDGGSVTDDTSRERPRRRATRPPRPRLVPTDVALGSIAVVYPPSATGEDLGDAGAIVDGSPGTAWRTPVYEDPATNPQIGVYVELPSAERLDELVVTSPTPGMRVEIYAAKSGPPASITSSGWSHLSDKTLQGKSTIPLPGSAYRYVLLWVTGLPPSGDHAAISGVRIVSQQPE